MQFSACFIKARLSCEMMTRPEPTRSRLQRNPPRAHREARGAAARLALGFRDTCRVDEIQFRLVDENHSDIPSIVPIINGTSLVELARVAETSAARPTGESGLAGSYSGLPAFTDSRWPLHHYLGSPLMSWFKERDTVLLGCDCGEWGCWPLAARVDVQLTTIGWTHFRNGYRHWDLSALGPFTFDRTQYETAVRAI